MRDFRGSKYDKTLSTTEIAKRVRTEIKTAVKAGELPAGKFSVTSDYFAGGSSIDIRIKALPFKILNPNYHENQLSFDVKRYNDNTLSLLKTLEAMLNAYNRDRSDTSTDYFDVKFYGHVSIDYALEAKERDELLQAPKCA